MWIYEQRTGKLSRDDGTPAIAYSGFGPAKNVPELQEQPGLGPIPRGAYLILGPITSERVGPMALPLQPLPGTKTFGRDAFFIHGDSGEHPGAASHGCIVVSRQIRESIAGSGDRLLVVLSGNPRS